MDRYLGLPPDFSTHGAQLDYLTGIVHWLMFILFAGWGAFFVYTLIRFRAKRNPVASHGGAKSHFSTYGEVGIALVEVVLLVGFAVPIWAQRVNQAPDPAESVVMRVVGEQFAWNVHYPGADGKFGRTAPEFVSAGTNPLGRDPKDPAGQDDIATINQLHYPVGRPVLIHLTSKDVIHSFSLPYMRVKQDAIPGLSIPVYFTAREAHEGEIACAQLCGLTHYRMKGFYTAHEPAAFEKWLADNAPKPSVAPPGLPPGAAPGAVPVEQPTVGTPAG
jgi:cytochrome c oxidase subunit II